MSFGLVVSPFWLDMNVARMTIPRRSAGDGSAPAGRPGGKRIYGVTFGPAGVALRRRWVRSAREGSKATFRPSQGRKVAFLPSPARYPAARSAVRSHSRRTSRPNDQHSAASAAPTSTAVQGGVSSCDAATTSTIPCSAATVFAA